jgi:ABC-type polysaccharide/polyol phosphate transport system ATPase subunit
MNSKAWPQSVADEVISSAAHHDETKWVEGVRGFLEGRRKPLANLAGGLPAEIDAALDLISDGADNAKKAMTAIRQMLGPSESCTVLVDANGQCEEKGRQQLFEFSRYVSDDASGVVEENGLRLRAGEKGRCRLIYQHTEPTERLCFNILLTINSAEHGEPLFALRLLHDNDPEETVLSFRYATLGVAGQFPLPVHVIGTTRLYTIIIEVDLLYLYIDGVPIWRGKRRFKGPKTGFNLDMIGRPGSGGNAIVHWIGLSSFSTPFSRLFPTEPELLRKLASAALSVGDEDLLRTLVYGREDSLHLTPNKIARESLIQIIEGSSSYPEGLVSAIERAHGGSLKLPAPPSPLLDVNAVSVSFAVDPAGKKRLSRMFFGPKEGMFNALRDVSFRAYPGDIIGVIGKNGAGKTTLLRAIQGSIPITDGRIQVRGNSLLLRPGAGMQGELTGRQNIMRGSLYMGLTPTEARDRMEEIIDFSELADHIDRPFRYYSDGMRARLVFALATSVSPDVLMLDELLGAGDRSFQEKALERLDSFLCRAKVVLVVQHALDFVLSRCTKCLYLKSGVPVFFGDPKIAAELYENE